MSQGKKGKRSKGKTVQLNEFLASTADGGSVGGGRRHDGPGGSGSTNTVVVVVSSSSQPSTSSSWADEVDDEDQRRGGKEITLPLAPRASLDSTPPEVGHNPPFSASLGNLPYDVVESDIRHFFANLKIEDIRIPRKNEDGGGCRGYAFIDFSDRGSLIEALTMTGQSIKNRNILITLITQTGDRYNRGGNRNNYDDDRTAGDWRSGPSSSSSSSHEYSRYNNRSGGDDRRGGGGGGYRRDEYRDRAGPSSGGFDNFSRDQMRPPTENRSFRSRDGFDDRRNDRYGDRRNDRFEERSNDRYGDRRNDRFEERSNDRFDDRRNDRFDDRRNDRYDNRRNDRYGDRRSDRSQDDGPRERPRLQLTKRSVDASSREASEAPTPRNSSIFGEARPVDTAKKEEEIIEKLKLKDDVKPPVTVFRGAKSADSTSRGAEIDERLVKKDLEEKGQLDEGEDEKRRRHPPRRDGRKDDHRRRQPSHREEQKQAADTKDRSPPRPKKAEEPSPTTFAGSNKFQSLQSKEDEGLESGSDDSN